MNLPPIHGEKFKDVESRSEQLFRIFDVVYWVNILLKARVVKK